MFYNGLKPTSGKAEFWQYDTDQTLDAIETIEEVHFLVPNCEEALVVVVENGRVRIPDELFLDSGYLVVYAYTSPRTLFRAEWPIKPRPRPETYPYQDANLNPKTIDQRFEEVEDWVKVQFGTPLVAGAAEAMTDTERIYVYVGSESGMSSGNWYYWDGSDWASGGVYNSTAFETDPTLTQSGHAADAASAGTELRNLKNDICHCNSCNLVKAYGTLQDVTRGGVTFTWDAAKEVCTLTGKRTAAAYNAVFSASGGMSGCFVAGETYHFAITSSSISTVYIRIYFNLSDSTSEQMDLKQASGTFTIPANTVSVSIRIQCDISTSVASIAETISFRILNAPSNRDLERDLSTLTGTVTGLDSALTGLLRTETGIGNPYFAPWSVQLNESSKFSLLDMPQNTIVYTLFSYLLDAETVNFPFSDFNAIFIEKIGRGNFNLYRIYGNNSERSAVGFYASGAFNWYACPTVKRIKIGMLGDSVTKGRIGGSSATTTKGIPYWVNYETGLPTVNLGVGSMGWISHYYAEQNAQEYIRTLDLSGYDVLTLQYGLNDGDQPLGTYEDTTEETIMGAVYRVIDYIYSQNATVQVIIINPTVGSKTETFPYFNPDLHHSASDRWTFTEYFAQMRLFCEKYAIPLIDGYKGLNAWNRGALIGDNVHPTETGYRVLGRYIAGQIKALI